VAREIEAQRPGVPPCLRIRPKKFGARHRRASARFQAPTIRIGRLVNNAGGPVSGTARIDLVRERWTRVVPQQPDRRLLMARNAQINCRGERGWWVAPALCASRTFHCRHLGRLPAWGSGCGRAPACSTSPRPRRSMGTDPRQLRVAPAGIASSGMAQYTPRCATRRSRHAQDVPCRALGTERRLFFGRDRVLLSRPRVNLGCLPAESDGEAERESAFWPRSDGGSNRCVQIYGSIALFDHARIVL